MRLDDDDYTPYQMAISFAYNDEDVAYKIDFNGVSL